MAHSFDGSDLSFIFTTIARNICARRLVDSALEFFPKIKVLVADQNPPTEEMEAFYRDRGVEVHWVPFDFGVSAGRALLARNVKTSFLVFGDDDYVFTSRTQFAPVIEYLKARPDVAIVTGTWVDNFIGKDGQVFREPRRYEANMYRDPDSKGLIAIPIDHMKPRVDVFNGEIFYQCDLGLNWAMTRTSLFDDERFLWDEQFKTNGEHENFFLQIKKFGGGRVMFYPLMECDHRPEAPSEYMRLRSREDGWIAFGRKWDLEWFLLAGQVFHQYKNYSGTGIKYVSATGGFASYLPKRNDDYLRIWANGSAVASVSDSVALREANQRERQAWQKADKRIEALRERLQKADAENERMTKTISELRDRSKADPPAPPPATKDAPGPNSLQVRLDALNEDNRRLNALVAQFEARAKVGAAPSSAADVGLNGAASALDLKAARANEELKEKNTELRERVARQRVEAQRQQAALDDLRKKLKELSAEGRRPYANQDKEF